MIHDATGKFSSRWPLPDRHSLALVMLKTGYAVFGALHAPGHPGALCGTSAPYRRICHQNQCYPRAWPRQSRPPGTGSGLFSRQLLRLLLAVVDQNLVAGLGELGTILLQAVQDNQIRLIHDRATVLLHVMSTGLLLLRRSAVLIGERRSGDR